ncbi:hypothetical protein [Bradyrhizobium sp. URHC0002]
MSSSRWFVGELPVAVVVAASFWTWLWGPLGLLLSTPLTLCLFARHVERLQFIDVMLGDQPALTPQQTAYQRMLTGDLLDAIEQARSFLKDGTALAYYEEILLGALRLAEADAAQGRLTTLGSKISTTQFRRSSRISLRTRPLR